MFGQNIKYLTITVAMGYYIITKLKLMLQHLLPIPTPKWTLASSSQ